MSISKPLKLVYSNLWDPIAIQVHDSYQFYVIFIDNFTKYTWLFSIKHKYDIICVFNKFKTIVEKYFNTSIVSYYSDNIGEFIKIISYFQQHRISRLAERRNRQIQKT